MSDQQPIDTAGAVSAYLNPNQDMPARAAQASMMVAADANPDFEAELRRASAKTGVPLDSARAFPEDVKRQATLADHDFEDMAKRFPSTTKFLADPENARIAHDDVANLSSAESTIGPITGPKPSFFSVAGGLLNSLPRGADMARQGIRMQLADLFGQKQVLADATSKYGQLALENKVDTPAFESKTAAGVYSGGTSLLRSLPGLAASIATRSPTPLLATIGVQTEADAYGKYRERGATAGEALLGGAAEGAVEVGTELLPMSFLVKNMGKVGAGHFLTGLLAREVPGEQIATLVQDAIDTAIANPDKTWSQYAAERPGAAYETLVATLTQAGVMEGGHIALARVQGKSQEAQFAGKVADALDQFNTVAAASKVRERDTATAQTFFQSLMQDGKDSVWITPQALAESGMLEQVAGAIPAVAAQLEQAAATGNDIKIPIADLMANLAGPEIANSIIPHLADEPGGFTKTTADEYMQSGAAQELAAEVARTLQSKAQDDAFTESKDAVSAGVLAQLNTAGRFAPTVNAAYASMVGNFFAVQAAKLGITPEEMAARYPLQVKAESMPGARTLEQPAYHGTPHQFDKFSTDHIGSGEGNQAYGWGLYFAGNKSVAEYYRKTLSKLEGADGKPAAMDSLSPKARQFVQEQIAFGTEPADMIKAAKQTAMQAEGWDQQDVAAGGKASRADYVAAMKEASAFLADKKRATGQLYNADIPESNELLHWDDPLNKQPANVQAALREVLGTKFLEGQDGASGEQLYRWVGEKQAADQFGEGDKGASGLLNSLGIKGIAYLDGASRSDGEGDHNYVIFHDDSAKITGKLYQGERGSLSFGDDITQQPSVITLFAGADFSTFAHEGAHFFLEVLNDIASRADAPAEMRADMDALLKWFGVADLAAWDALDLEGKRPHHEAFARGFEAYLFEGKAPTSDLAGLFSRFRSWMVNVYKSLTALNVELTPEVRGVFDRMLASSEAIAQAEREAGFAGMFGTRPEFMSDDEWQAYRALTMQASTDAAHELESRSVRDMQWLGNATNGLLGKMRRDAAAKRRAIRDEVEAEVRAEPVQRAKAHMREHSVKADDATAELFQFNSGQELEAAIKAEPPLRDKIRDITNARMLERYGDLTDQAAIDRAVNEALHQKAHAKFVATEMVALRKAAGQPAVLAKAAQQYAEQIVRRTPIKELRPNLFTAAAKRAGQAADKAFTKGDVQEAAAQKQIQLINTYAAKAAMDARDQVEKTMVRFRTITNGNNEKVAKTRDLDMVMATRAILAEFGIGTRGKKAAEYLEAVDAYDPAMAKVLRDRIDTAGANAKPVNELTIEELGALRDEVESLLFLAKRSRQMEVDGDLMDRSEVQDVLRARLEDIGIPDLMPGEKHAITPGEVNISKLQSLRAAMRRIEAWAGAKDGTEEMGPFRRFIWNTIKDPADAYRADKGKYLKAYRALLEPIAPSLVQMKIAAPELGYTFGFDHGGMGKVELLHAVLHTGNIGNKKKLLLGRGWAEEMPDGSINTSKWDSFVARMIEEGTLTRADFDFAQGVWGLLEDMKPAAQKAHRDVFGRYFDEVTADPFSVTMKGGQVVQYAGGYIPAIADSRIVSDAKTRAILEEELSSLANVMPATSKGFTKSRVEYNRPLLLDLRLLAQHIDKVLLFTHLEQPVRDVRRILGSDTVASAMHKVDPAAYDGLLTPWLNRAARQQVETPVAGDSGTMRFFSVVRSRAGMAAMFANVSNTAQQITGFSIAALRVKPVHLMAAAADFIRSPKQMAAAVAAQSPYMANRMENEVGAMTDAINDILLNPGVYESAKAWGARHTYFLQSAVDNVMGPIIWHGAYNQALETAPGGLSESELALYARRLADSAVRETQGSTLPEDISRIETGNAFVRIFTQFAGYFNMQANILGTEFARIPRDMGLRKGLGRGFYVMLFGFLAPAWVAQAIALAFRGGPDDEDKDGSYLDDWLAQTFGWGTLRAGTAMVPVLGQAANALANTFNHKPYDDKISTGPAISMIESAVSVPSDIYKLATGAGSATKTVRDVATLVTLMTGLPVAGAARPLVYAVDVASGKVKPTGPVDAARGAITGTASPASKGR